MPTQTNPLPGKQSSISLKDGTQLDPKVVKVMRAIRQIESGHAKDPYTAVGDNGSSLGAYQWNNDNKPLQQGQTPTHWQDAAKRFLGDSNAPMSPANQNKVAYHQILEYKSAGLEPDEIAARWNGAHIDPITSKYTYNNPEYGKKFRQALTAQVASFPPQQEGSTQPITSPPVEYTNDSINPLSTILQGVGAGAGFAGDIINKGLEFIPGVSQAEGLLGKGVEALADTGVGKSVVSGYQAWAQEHPEAAGNLGAVVNIASIIPVFKALSFAKTATKSALAKAFEGRVTKAATQELENSLSTAPGRKVLSAAQRKGINPAQEIVKRNYTPEVTKNADGNSIYSFKSADELANSEESTLEKKLQATLASKPDNPISLTIARNQAIKEARNSVPFDVSLPSLEKKIHDTFKFWEERYGKKASLSGMTDMKRGVRENVKFDTPAIDKDASYYIGQGLMKAVEDTAGSRGIQGVGEINKEMGKIIQLRKVMAHLEGKRVKLPKSGGILKEITADTIGAMGEVAGQSMGVPVVGAFTGRAVGRSILGKGTKSSFEKLSKINRARTPILPSIKQSLKRIAPLMGLQSVHKE